MKKLRMDVEALDVESFPVAPAQPEFRGTVRAEDFATFAKGLCKAGLPE